ncbi:MAG: histidine kinase [Bacteroidetes bacterium]|nr:histidine kinase [Bacteroidota bacterium]MCH8523324.1 histidine kinase [Balneolales bacterium]
MHFDFPNYNTNNGLVSNVVHHSMQDDFGYMWFATDSGVSRFDGNRFRHFTTQDGLGGNEIFYIYQDSQQRLWFLSFNGVPSYFQNNTFFNPSNDSLLARLRFGNMLVSVFEDHDQAIWFFSQDASIYRVSSDNQIEKFGSEGLVHTIRQAWVDEDNVIHAGTSLNTYYLDFATGKWIEKNDINYRVIQHQQTHQGSFLIPSRSGIVYSGSAASSPPYTIHKNQLGIQAEITFVTRTVNSVYLAVGTIADGVHFYNYDGKNTQQKVSHLLPGKTITSVTFDNQESVWITTVRNGIYRIDRSFGNIQNIAAKHNLFDFSIRSSFTSSDGYQWYGTDSGRIFVFDTAGTYTEVTWDEIRPINISVEDFTELPDGRLGIVTATTFYLVNRQGNRLTTTDKITALSGKQLVYSNNRLFYGAIDGLYVAHVDTPDAFERILNQRITSLKACNANNLWVGSINGLYRFDEHLELTALPEEFRNQQITKIEYLYNGIVAVATHGSGVWIYNTNNEKLHQIHVDNGLADDLVKTIAYDQHTLWISTGTGISLIPLSPELELDFQLDRLPQGIRYFSGRLFGTQIRHIQLREHNLWLSGDNTILSLDRAESGASPTLVPFHLYTIIVNDQLYTHNFPDVVDHYNNQWSFTFTGLLFHDADRLLYRYRLREVNSTEDWSVTANNEVTYRSIPPGHYVFEAEAFTSDGNAGSHMIAHHFTILRPWWMLPWVWAISLVLALSGILLLFNYRIRLIQKKEEEKHQYQRQINELEYQALQAMMSPHFVFNILNNIRYQILKDDKVKASKLLVDFSKLIRKQLDSAYQRTTSLSEELDRLELYVSVESSRLPHPVSFIKHIAQDVDTITTHIPSMLLQPFVENAIIHGIMPKGAAGEITICVKRSDDEQLEVVIIDNGTGLKNDRRPTIEGNRLSLGVTLVEQRLAILAKENGLKWRIEIDNMTDNNGEITGVRASVLMPLR